MIQIDIEGLVLDVEVELDYSIGEIIETILKDMEIILS